MSNRIIERDELSTLLPHKGKMFLLTRLVSYDIAAQQRSLRSEYDITGECLFYDPALGGVPAWVSFEFMAQSIAVLSGLTGREKGEPPKPGFILSVSNMEIMIPVLRAGTTACIQVQEDCRVESVFTFDCVVSLNGTTAAQAKLTIMEADDMSVFEKREVNSNGA
ncbi:thioester dehydrase [Spirochaetia bacterium]|nr:thioester dehydrase [Spirochaetia bacterium]